MRVGDKVSVDTGIGYSVEGVVIAVFPESEDANIRVSFGGADFGDYYEEELVVLG